MVSKGVSRSVCPFIEQQGVMMTPNSGWLTSIRYSLSVSVTAGRST